MLVSVISITSPKYDYMEKEILELEKKYWSGMENHDYDVVKNLTHFPCMIAGQHGVQLVDEQSFKRMFDSGAGKRTKVMNIHDEQVAVVKDTATIIYRIEIQYNGSSPSSVHQYACASTWIKENEKWVCCLHTEAEMIGELKV